MKLADLGITKRVQSDTTALYTSFDGSFMAPEILGFTVDVNVDRYTKAVDCWALGCLAYWLMTLQNVIPRQSLFNFCSTRRTLSTADLSQLEASPEGIDYITALVKADSKERLTAREALNHSWIQHASLITAEDVSDTQVASPPFAKQPSVEVKTSETLAPFPTIEDVSDEEYEQGTKPRRSDTTTLHSISGTKTFLEEMQQQEINVHHPETSQQQSVASPPAKSEAHPHDNEQPPLKDDLGFLDLKAGPEETTMERETSTQSNKGNNDRVFEAQAQEPTKFFGDAKRFSISDPSDIFKGFDREGGDLSNNDIFNLSNKKEHKSSQEDEVFRRSLSPPKSTRAHSSHSSKFSVGEETSVEESVRIEPSVLHGTTSTSPRRWSSNQNNNVPVLPKPEIIERMSRPRSRKWQSRSRERIRRAPQQPNTGSPCGHQAPPTPDPEIQKLQDDLWDELRNGPRPHFFPEDSISKAAQRNYNRNSNNFDGSSSSESSFTYEGGKQNVRKISRESSRPRSSEFILVPNRERRQRFAKDSRSKKHPRKQSESFDIET